MRDSRQVALLPTHNREGNVREIVVQELRPLHDGGGELLVGVVDVHQDVAGDHARVGQRRAVRGARARAEHA